MTPAGELPDAELDVMTRLWRQGALTARQIRESLAERRPMSHSSVCTLLGRLEEKGWVVREKGETGKAFLYRAKAPPQSTHRRMLSELADRLFGGRGASMVAALFQARPPSLEEIEELETLLAQLREKQLREDHHFWIIDRLDI